MTRHPDHWLPNRRPDDWRQQAACLDHDSSLFFPDGDRWDPREYQPALKVCRGCSVRAECLEFALTHDERYGIWGGYLPSDRSRMKGRKA